jgi:hypothetical protein
MLNDIRNQLQSGTPVSAIINKFQLSFNMTISYQQISKIRHDMINDLVRSVGEKPSFSAAD